jgi:hypothetical protein
MSEVQKKKIETNEFRESLLKKKGYKSKMKKTIEFLSRTKRNVENTKEVKKGVGNLLEKYGAIGPQDAEKMPLTEEEELAFKQSLFQEIRQVIMNGSGKGGHKEINTKNLCSLSNLEALIMDGDFVLSNFENFRDCIQKIDPLMLLAQQVITNGDQLKNSKKIAAPRKKPNRRDSSLSVISKMMSKVENNQTTTPNPTPRIFHRPSICRNNSSDAVAGNAPIKLNDFEKMEMHRRDTIHSSLIADFSPQPRKRSI